MTTRKSESSSKGPAKKAAKKTTAKKSPAKSSAKSLSRKSGGERKYSSDASKSVEREMREMKEGNLKSGGSGKKVTNPKQAIAIGLSEARRTGKKVPPNPNN